jgi:hypothetical protein
MHGKRQVYRPGSFKRQGNQVSDDTGYQEHEYHLYRFPETQFELFLLLGGMVVVYGVWCFGYGNER